MSIKMKITKGFVFLIALITLTVIDANAQRNFKPGYVVSIKGDTTKGWIDYRDWSLNPKQIAFKTQENGSVDLYSAKTLAAFGISEYDSYKRYAGPVSLASVNITKLINNKDTRVKQDTVFLRLITAGKHLSLLEYTDEVKQRFFIAEGAAAPVELNFYKYFNQKNDGIITDNAYKQQLQRLVANYEPGNQKLITQIQKTEYIPADMEKAVMAINGTESNKAASRSELVLFGGLAANATHTTIRGAARSSTSNLPQLNAGLNFVLNKNVRAFIVRAELNVTGSKADVTQNSSIMDPSVRTVFDKVILV